MSTAAQISFTVPDIRLKQKASEKAKRQGLSMKAVILAFLEDYVNNDYALKLVRKDVSDDIMTDDNFKHWQAAKKDLKNNVNIVSQEEIYAKYL